MTSKAEMRSEREIQSRTGRHFSVENTIRIVLDGSGGDDSIAELCRREGKRSVADLAEPKSKASELIAGKAEIGRFADRQELGR